MARLKFFIFSLVVLGLWGAHLFLVSPALSARAVEQARAAGSRASAPVSAMFDARRGVIQKAALVVASDARSAASLPGRGGRIEAPSVARLDELRTQLSDSLPVELRGTLVLGLVNEVGAVMVQGVKSGEAPAQLEARSITSAGIAGTTRLAFGLPHQFVSVPITVLERGESLAIGHILVGAPLVTEELLENVAHEAQLDGVVLMKDGEVLMAAGAQKDLARRLGPMAPSEKVEIVEKGRVAELGPFKLPILTSGDLKGGSAPLWISSRRTLDSTPYEVVAITSVAPFMTALADYQRKAIFSFGGLLFLSVVLVGTMGNRKKTHSEPDEADREASEPMMSAQIPPAASTRREPPPPVAAIPQDPEEPQGFPDSAPPVPLFAEAEARPRALGDEFAGPFGPPVPYEDPFAPAATGSLQEPNFNPEETRVAAIPHELLQAATRNADDFLDSMGASAPAQAPPPVAAAADADEAHFLEVFRAFIQTRESCGEPADGLSYEKFAQRLRKNREQLVAKYACRTVRFQVHVKDGKAAIKATPVKNLL